MTSMLLALLQSAVAVSAQVPVPAVYSGRAGQLEVTPPRIEAAIEVDGVLSEPAWGQAALLKDFSQFLPQDGVPAQDSTELLVWYSPTALHLGIRGFEAHGIPQATLAERDRIFADDWIEILLGTFNDGRTATMFGVNPLGVQADGALVEVGQSSGGFGSQGAVRDRADLSPDYTWDSRGALVPGGFVIEVRIPFKSLRFQPTPSQTWGLHISRRVQHSGYEDTWVPSDRSRASFLQQAGRLTGLTELRRGLVVDINPEMTAAYNGARTGDAYGYGDVEPDVGGSLRWGVTNNLTLNAAVNPDFSQVESDAGQLSFDPRQSLFFSEKRPFFLDGIEQFNTPSNLIYTRRIVQPVAAVKLTGKGFGTDLAFMSAVDDGGTSATGSNPVYNILRAQRGLGGGSRVGLAYTDKVDGDNYNRVGSVDGRWVFGGVYAVLAQGALSRTRTNDVTVTDPLWNLRFDRNGERFGWRSFFSGIGDDFRAQSGFINRTGVVRLNFTPNYSWLPPRGSLVERVTASVALDGTWQYRKFTEGDGWQDRKFQPNVNVALRGGWGFGIGWFLETFGYDEDLYAGYVLGVPDGMGGVTYQPFIGQPTINNNDVYITANTPVFKRVDANIFLLYGYDENFPEWASGRIFFFNWDLNFRPSDQVRLGVSYDFHQVNRPDDGSQVQLGRVTRAKLEYQISRPFAVRLVGEYVTNRQDSLRDDSRTGHPIYFSDGAGGFTRAVGFEDNRFQADVLIAYRPTPGTVVFAGYGSTMTEPETFRFRDLRRERDSFFAKVSYLFRL